MLRSGNSGKACGFISKHFGHLPRLLYSWDCHSRRSSSSGIRKDTRRRTPSERIALPHSKAMSPLKKPGNQWGFWKECSLTRENSNRVASELKTNLLHTFLYQIMTKYTNLYSSQICGDEKKCINHSRNSVLEKITDDLDWQILRDCPRCMNDSLSDLPRGTKQPANADLGQERRLPYS